MRSKLGSLPATRLLLLLTVGAAAQTSSEPDPLEPILRPVLRSSVSSLVEHYRSERIYPMDAFPLPPPKFEAFREDVTARLVRSLDLEKWVVRRPQGKQSPIRHLFRDKVIKTIRHHAIEMEIHLIELLETGDRIPVVLCLPRPEDATPEEFAAIRDKCHILPGMFKVGDRNLLLLAYAPRPLLAGHGRKDRGSHEQAPRYYRDFFAGQYRALGKESAFEYRVHEGGDTMPDEVVIEYFRRRFEGGRE